MKIAGPARGRGLRWALCGTLAVMVATGGAGGCTVYQPVPVYAPGPASFDRSWNAALGAMDDVGVRITSADRSTGIIQGTRDSFVVTSSVRMQADGSLRVEFSATGPTALDPTLSARISSAYDRRMGR
jgi:hypothetical protein